MKKIIIGLIIAGRLMVSTAHADQTTLLLYNYCKESKPDSISYCEGHISAWVDGFVLGAGVVAQKYGKDWEAERSFCLPDSGGPGMQLRLVFVKWVEQNPEKILLPWDMSVFSAMQASFPCDH